MSPELLAAQAKLFGLIIGFMEGTGVVSRGAFATNLRALAETAESAVEKAYLSGLAEAVAQPK